MKKVISVTSAAKKIGQIASDWVLSNSTESIANVTIKAAKKLSNDPIFNLAAFMKYNFGPCISSESDSDWLDSAKQISQFFEYRRKNAREPKRKS